MGMYRLASECNERAGVFKPNSDAVAYNRVYFENKLNEKGENENDL